MAMPGEEMSKIESRKRKGFDSSSSSSSRPYSVGDVVDLKHLLFEEKRDFLIRNNNDLDRAQQLEGKVVILYFVLLKRLPIWVWKHAKYLVDVYTELLSSPSCPFEVVFVAVTDEHDDDHPKISEKNFQDLFSIMPWTAIPFSASQARRQLEKSFLGSESGTYTNIAFVISQTGVVLQDNALLLMKKFGIEGYPFSNQTIQSVVSEDEEARVSPSLKNLLVSPECDYVINNKGDKVKIRDLEDKVVALFFYEKGWTKELTETLRDAYKYWVEEKKMNFEVVLIYVSNSWHTIGCTNAESFQKVFETMPWLALPYNDRNCKKLLRVFNYPFELGLRPEPDPSLVIIGPHGEFFEPGGSRILMSFGIDVYPWTSDKVCSLQVEKVKKIDLNMLFGLETVFIRECESEVVRFSDINVGKRIVVFCDYTRYDEVYEKFRIKLQKKYLDSKGKNDEFEVIYLDPYKNNKEPFKWLRLNPDRDDYVCNLIAAQKVFTDCLLNGYGILVFDVDGKMVRATSYPTFEREDIDFPFYAGSVEEELVKDIKGLYMLDGKIVPFCFDLH